jgi:hypothetical protein
MDMYLPIDLLIGDGETRFEAKHFDGRQGERLFTRLQGRGERSP